MGSSALPSIATAFLSFLLFYCVFELFREWWFLFSAKATKPSPSPNVRHTCIFALELLSLLLLFVRFSAKHHQQFLCGFSDGDVMLQVACLSLPKTIIQPLLVGWKGHSSVVFYA